MNANGSVRKTKVTVDRKQFFLVCGMLLKHKQQFLDEKPTAQEAAKMLEKLVGFPMSPGTVKEVQEATHVEWTARTVTSSRTKISQEDLKTLANATARLYRKLSEEVPAELKVLWEKLNSRSLAAEVFE